MSTFLRLKGYDTMKCVEVTSPQAGGHLKVEISNSSTSPSFFRRVIISPWLVPVHMGQGGYTTDDIAIF